MRISRVWKLPLAFTVACLRRPLRIYPVRKEDRAHHARADPRSSMVSGKEIAEMDYYKLGGT